MKSAADAVRCSTAVAFDLFHTLTSIEASWGRDLPLTHEILGISRDAWERQWERTTHARLIGDEKDPAYLIGTAARRINPRIADETIEAAVAGRVKRFGAALLDVPQETMRVLEGLRREGKRLGLVSNADVMEITAWDQSPLASAFDAAVFSCHVRVVKPDREIYQICLDRLGVRAAETVFVGDGGSSELQGARAVGMVTVMMTGIVKEFWPEEIPKRRPYADFVVEELAELLVAQGDGGRSARP